jgi:hypothetical protein
MAKNTKTGKAARVAKVIAGTRMHFASGSQPVTLEGASTTIDGVVNELQAFVDNRNKIVAARTEVINLVASEREGTAALNALLGAFIAFVRQTLGSTSPALADFGIPLRKARQPKTVEQKALANAKREATREARGTKGPKAKQAIHGNVTAVVVTPVAGSATVAPEVPAPAPTAAAPAAVPATPVKG